MSSRDAFLKNLDHFYKAIEDAASTMEEYSEKQQFLNRIYEKFFQSFNKKQADTHGIVYEPFEGICLVDTFELAEPKQAGFEFMTVGNTERIKKQKQAPIFVVIGNPPYNAWQKNENDQNRNRKYPYLSARIAESYSKYSTATNKNALADPYVKAFRWASDRIKAGGLVCFVSNDSFIDQLAFDGMRKCLSREFDNIYVLDLGGNVRKNPKLSGTTHNVFGIQVGVSITILVRDLGREPSSMGKIFYARVPEDWRRTQKYTQLEQWNSLNSVQWKRIKPDDKNTWLTAGLAKDWDALVPLRDGIFALYSNGVKTNRDAWAYNHSPEELARNAACSIDFYNGEIERYIRKKRPSNINSFVNYDDQRISWSRDLKQDMQRGRKVSFERTKIRNSLYRPFGSVSIFFDRVFNEEVYAFPSFMPNESAEHENKLIALTGIGSEKPFMALAAHTLVDLHLVGAGCGSQCFPFYTYDEDGKNRRENITDGALAEFRKHYGDKSLSKWDIFHATYAILHHPEYRTRYAANLKRELPRIPFVPEFRQYAKIGESLMKLHIEYEQQKEYPLQRTEKGQLNWRVEKMKLSKDKTQLTYNDFLTLSGIPAEVYEYRLGNRSALEWIVDQYRVSTDKRSGIVNDPNRDDDPEYIVRLIGQVITVSVETVKLERELNGLKLLPK